MEEKAVVDAVKLRVIRRQAMSKENHICRIRSATAIRMLESLPDIFEAIPSQNLNVSQNRCYFNSRRYSHQNYAPTEFWEELNNNNLRRSLAGNRRIREKKRKSFTVPDLGNTRTHFLGNIKFNFKDELEESLADKEYLIPKNPFASEDYDFSFDQDSKELFDNKEFFQCEDSSEGNEINFRRNIDKTFDEEEVLKLKSPLSSEDNVSDTEDELKEMYTNKAICTVEAIPSSKKGKCASNEESVERNSHIRKDQTHFKIQIIKLIFDASFSVEIERRASNEKIIRINSQTQENKTDSTVEVITHAPNTEIRVSEIGKLQIAFGSKNISPEDTPIAIRTDDNSKAIFTSKANPFLEERKCTSNEESVDRTPHAQKHQTHSKTQITKLVFDATFSVEIEKRSSKEKIIRIHSQTQENKSDSKVKLITHASNEEIHVLEIEKLQITFDSKNISPEDTAIVILTKDDPEKLSIPECDMLSNITPESYAEQTGYPTEVIGSLPESKRKNARKSKTDSDLQFSAKESNNAAFSKFKMISLSTLYKRNDLSQKISFPNN